MIVVRPSLMMIYFLTPRRLSQTFDRETFDGETFHREPEKLRPDPGIPKSRWSPRWPVRPSPRWPVRPSPPSSPRSSPRLAILQNQALIARHQFVQIIPEGLKLAPLVRRKLIEHGFVP